jgi:hypothetical protein
MISLRDYAWPGQTVRPATITGGAKMGPVVKAAVAYVAPVFIVAFGVGALRVMLVAPVIGPLLAVALELPVILALSWVVAGRVLRHRPLGPRQRRTMAGLAFTLLMLAELLTALAFGQTPAQFFAAQATPPGVLGLLGQIGFGLIPLVRQARG